MKTLMVKHPLTESQKPTTDIVLIMGFFDGVHCGHQEVIRNGVKLAQEKGLKSVLLTFDRSPREVYQRETDHKYLSTIKRKEELIAKMGVDYLYFMEFSNDFAHLTPQEFVDQYMIDMSAKYVVAGFDYTYGKRDVANMENLQNFSRDKFKVIQVPEQTFDDKKIGSTEIKELLLSGKVELANKLLGYNYQNHGEIIHGLQRGRTLGFPTANLSVGKKQVVPGVGVYVTRMLIDGKWYPAMTQIGYNITFDDNTGKTIETNIFNFDKDIYGENVRLEWLHYLRGETKFSDADGLIQQLKEDREHSLKFFSDDKDF